MGFFSLFSQPLINEKYVFFDVETTGLYPLAGDRIIEIAMIKTVNGETIDTINTFINPGIPIPEAASNINNITNEMVKESPFFDKEMGNKILDFIKDSILVAHNAQFDLGFISTELGRIGIIFEGWQSIDTLKIAQNIFPGQKNKLENLMRRYNILPEGDLHRALIDTDALKKIFFEFLEETNIRSSTVDQLIKKFGFKGNHLHRNIPAIIRESMIENKNVYGKYRTRDGSIIDLKITPIAPVWIKNKWYLLANDCDSKKIVPLYCKNFTSLSN